MDDLLVVEEAQIVSLRDQLLIAWGKATPETKAWVKKAADAEKKLVEKQEIACKQTKAKNQALSFRKLVLSNS